MPPPIIRVHGRDGVAVTGFDGGDEPAGSTAVTTKVYFFPFLSPASDTSTFWPALKGPLPRKGERTRQNAVTAGGARGKEGRGALFNVRLGLAGTRVCHVEGRDEAAGSEGRSDGEVDLAVPGGSIRRPWAIWRLWESEQGRQGPGRGQAVGGRPVGGGAPTAVYLRKLNMTGLCGSCVLSGMSTAMVVGSPGACTQL